MTKPSNRLGRIGQQIQRELADLIQREIKDPRLPKFITVSAVTVTRDLSHAKVYITVLDNDDNDDHAEIALEILQHAASYLRSNLARRINLRTTPELHFVYDQSIRHGSQMTKLIEEAMRSNKSDES